MRRPKSIFRRVIWGVLLFVLLSCYVSVQKSLIAQPVFYIGMILGAGGLGDRSFNDSAYEGLRDA